ncbi:MAG: hypothetical protein LBU61_02740, partial [Coriobacteriales bacterium]|nr:hypothetical protein [Coriobacteriales bacterium]
MKSIDKKPLPWSALLTSLKSQVNFAKALFGVSLMAALVLGLTTYFTLLGRNHTRDVLIQTATSTVSASCYATRELIDAELVFSLKKPEDAIAQADSYQHTLIDITNLKYSINAERIYVVRRLGTEYLIVWDTDSANARAFTNVELNDIQIEAFTGTFSLEIHNPGDMSASLNNGALPLFYHSEVIAVVCVDFSTQYVNEADNTTSFLVYMLIGSVATMMSVLFVVALILFKQNQRNQQQLFDMANQDIVTGLPNRR